MQKIVNLRKYDTDRDNLVSEYSPILPVTASLWYRERLYQRQDGRWYLHGLGNRHSPWSTEGIVPLTERGATQWLAEREDV